MTIQDKKKLKADILALFTDLEFDDELHQYRLKSLPDLKLKSATSLVKQYDTFDSEYWSKKKAEEYKTTPEKILEQWSEISKQATERGSRIHQYLEYKTQGDKVQGINVPKEYRKTLMSLYRFLAGKYKIICNELRMFDSELGICGTCDVLAINLETGKLVLLDYKTGKTIERVATYVCKKTGILKKSNFKLEYPFNNLPKSNFYKYSIQLNIYRTILKRVGIEIDEMILIHISPEEFTIHKADYLDLINDYPILCQN
jgi:hypothetical protein